MWVSEFNGDMTLKVKVMSEIEVKHYKTHKSPSQNYTISDYISRMYTKLCILSGLLPWICTKVLYFAPPQELPEGHIKIP